jgi:hypothetical protein
MSPGTPKLDHVADRQTLNVRHAQLDDSLQNIRSKRDSGHNELKLQRLSRSFIHWVGRLFETRGERKG